MAPQKVDSFGFVVAATGRVRFRPAWLPAAVTATVRVRAAAGRGVGRTGILMDTFVAKSWFEKLAIALIFSTTRVLPCGEWTRRTPG